MERSVFDKWMLLHIGVGFLGFHTGISEKNYIITHTAYELLSNTSFGMEFVNGIPLWPKKENRDDAWNMIADPFWGWVGFRLAAGL